VVPLRSLCPFDFLIIAFVRNFYLVPSTGQAHGAVLLSLSHDSRCSDVTLWRNGWRNIKMTPKSLHFFFSIINNVHLNQPVKTTKANSQTALVLGQEYLTGISTVRFMGILRGIFCYSLCKRLKSLLLSACLLGSSQRCSIGLKLRLWRPYQTTRFLCGKPVLEEFESGIWVIILLDLPTARHLFLEWGSMTFAVMFVLYLLHDASRAVLVSWFLLVYCLGYSSDLKMEVKCEAFS
jgi:hypothetical protein